MANKLLFSLPKPTKISVTDNTRNYTNKEWPIKTFITEENKNVNETIDYYYQKMVSFVKIANQQLNSQLQQYHNVNSIEELFQQTADTYDKNVADIWNAIQKTSTKELQPKVQELNKYTRELSAAGSRTISFASVLSILTNGSPNGLPTSYIPGTIDINSFRTNLNSFAHATGSPSNIGAHRAVTMGQIYEIGVNEMIADNMRGILKYFATGNKRTRQSLTDTLPGKTDGLLTINGINIDLKEIDSSLRGKLTGDTKARQTIILEADEVIDSTQLGFEYAIQKYIANPSAAAMIGIQNKGWTGTNGTMGSFERSAQEIRSRSTWTPSGQPITEWFANEGRFGNYTGYVLSKYLISVIGAYNALMATGAHGITPTYMWLWNLYMSNKHLRHTFNLMETVESIMKDHTRVMLNKNERGYRGAAIYTVRNNIIIANRKFA